LVIAVIAILASVLIPAFSGIIAKAKYNRMVSDCTNALKQHRMNNPGVFADRYGGRYHSAYFIYKGEDRIYYFRSGSDDNVTETDESDIPDFSYCAYADLYESNPISMSGEELISSLFNYYRVDDPEKHVSIFYLVAPFNKNGMRTIFEVTDFSPEYYYYEDGYYTSARLADVVLNEERVPRPEPGVDYIEDANGIRYSPLEDGTAEIVGYAGTSADLVIPQYSPDGRRVTSVAVSGLESHYELKSVVLPEGLTKLNARAFYQCTTLESVTLPSTLTRINSAAFYGCAQLKGVVLPGSLELIERMAFCGCPKLTDMAVPRGTVLKPGCLGGVLRVTFAGDDPYETERYRIDGECIIEKSTGVLISGNDNSVIPNDSTVTKIGENSFSYIKRAFDLYIPASVKSIDKNAFYGSKIITVTGGEGLVTLAAAAFIDSSLSSFTLGTSVQSLGNSVFVGCSDLVLTVENGVTISSSLASGVRQFVIRDDNPDYKKSGSAVIRRSDNTIIASEREYAFPTDPGEYRIAVSAFCACETPVNFVLPENVIYVGENAFSRTTSKTVRFTENIATISASTLSFC
ncbi:MAG: leucine-rich repeat domain-containing protein, partial [Clostridia bacterium]|nr:leucine-rich repeat domain-containing protein [Clostridia bacterium]